MLCYSQLNRLAERVAPCFCRKIRRPVHEYRFCSSFIIFFRSCGWPVVLDLFVRRLKAVKMNAEIPAAYPTRRPAQQNTMSEHKQSEMPALIPLEQRQVLFYEDEVTAVVVAAGERRQVFVPLRPLTENLGLAWSGQYERLQRDPVLSAEIRSVRVTRTEAGRLSGQASAEVSREMVCLPLDYLNGWLFGINANRVKPEIRERLIRYQRDCYQVLHEAFLEGRLSADPDFDELLDSDSPAAQAYRLAAAMMRLARQQLVLEGQLESHGQQLADHERRLEEVEATLGDPGRHITPDQASQISQSVKAVALALGKKTGRNEYGGVYGEFYRRFGITSYKLLPARRFAEAISFLDEWHQSLEGSVPF